MGSRDGPSFSATGQIVKDAAVEEMLLKTFAQKYADGWGTHGERFRTGFKDGTRVLIKYTPADEKK